MKFENLSKNISDILNKSVCINKDQFIILLYDTDSELGTILKEEYEKQLKEYNVQILNFKDKPENEWAEYLQLLRENDLCILIQSSSFRISKFRIRLELNNRGVYVIEHVRLMYIKENEYETYINSLEFDREYLTNTSNKIIDKLKDANKVEIISKDQSILTYEGKFEEAKPNIGDMSKSKGSLFPIGEVFTEPIDLSKVNGEVLVYAFPNKEHRTAITKSFKVEIKDGLLVNHNGSVEFNEILDLIKTENNDDKVPLREMGFGMNKHINKEHSLNDISSHERQIGFHISLGLKHAIYRKKIPKEVNQRYHMDIFVDLDKIKIDDVIVFENSKWIL